MQSRRKHPGAIEDQSAKLKKRMKPLVLKDTQLRFHHRYLTHLNLRPSITTTTTIPMTMVHIRNKILSIFLKVGPWVELLPILIYNNHLWAFLPLRECTFLLNLLLPRLWLVPVRTAML
jgi:hypothetical protein